MNNMAIQEIWEIKEKLSERFWGKSADEINDLIKPNVDEMKSRINEMRKVNERKISL
jgi:hypothetical protein